MYKFRYDEAGGNLIASTGSINSLKFDEAGLIPAIVQEAKTGEVLMLAYMSRESLRVTLQEGSTCFYSRSRQQLWRKGETSGNTQKVASIHTDCDRDALLILVDTDGGPACHTGDRSCFGIAADTDDSSDAGTDAPMGIRTDSSLRESCGDSQAEPVQPNPAQADENRADSSQTSEASILNELYGVIADRKGNPQEGSYTTYLFSKGQDKILKKVGEEAAEVIIASKNNSVDEIVYEVGDLFFHTMVLLADHGISPEQIFAELRRRRK